MSVDMRSHLCLVIDSKLITVLLVCRIELADTIFALFFHVFFSSFLFLVLFLRIGRFLLQFNIGMLSFFVTFSKIKFLETEVVYKNKNIFGCVHFSLLDKRMVFAVQFFPLFFN